MSVAGSMTGVPFESHVKYLWERNFPVQTHRNSNIVCHIIAKRIRRQKGWPKGSIIDECTRDRIESSKNILIRRRKEHLRPAIWRVNQRLRIPLLLHIERLFPKQTPSRIDSCRINIMIRKVARLGKILRGED